VKRELAFLVAAVLVVDALFIAGYFLFRLPAASTPAKVVYTAAWTVLTLVVVVRALGRIRALRGRGGS
jgi:multidrug efflux pump subunit AcrA (membrane-fusion protein)